MKHRALYIASTLIEVAFVVGAFVLDYFSRAKLGMNRWLVHANRGWEQALPMPAVEVAVLVVLGAVCVLALVSFARMRQKRPLACASLVAAFVLLVVCIWFAVVHTSSSLHAFYLMGVCLALACLIQGLKAIVLARVAR